MVYLHPPDRCLPGAGTLGKQAAKLFSQGKTVIPQILLRDDGGLSFRHDDVDFARCIVNRGGSTFGRIAVCVKLAAESAGLFGCALSGIEIHEIPARTHGFVRRVALGVKRHENAA